MNTKSTAKEESQYHTCNKVFLIAKYGYGATSSLRHYFLFGGAGVFWKVYFPLTYLSTAIKFAIQLTQHLKKQ